MGDRTPGERTRRSFLRACLATPAAFVLAACAGQAAGTATPAASPASTAPPAAAPTSAPAIPPAAAPTQSPPASAPAPTQVVQVLAPTPACGDDDDEATPAQTEGPYYTPNTPERASLIEPGVTGVRLVIAGQVLTTDCKPVGQALLDFWQADDRGIYDNAGYRLRGHQFADDQGRYQLETIVPGLYPGRTRHIHVKVQAPNQPALTTQLYFPNEPRNGSDQIFSSDLLVDLRDDGDGKQATFDFVLDIG